jgi:hypothetical protein
MKTADYNSQTKMTISKFVNKKIERGRIYVSIFVYVVYQVTPSNKLIHNVNKKAKIENQLSN